MFEQISGRQSQLTVIGCGLIGGSFARAARANGLVDQIVGVDVDASSLEEAVRIGVIDRYETDLAQGVRDSDLILIAVPVRQTVAILELLANLPLKPGCIVTDVCSTKREVCAAALTLHRRGVHFIAGHPMTGSEKSGVHAGNERLFEKAVYVLTPDVETDPSVVEQLSRFVEGMGAQVLLLDAGTHDHVVAAISHLPHIIAAELVDQVASYGQTSPLYTRLAAGGFRDVTRIAAANPDMWRDVLLSNRDVLLGLIDDWLARMNEVRRWLDREDGSSIHGLFTRSRAWREALPVRASGAMRPALQCTVEVKDEPGVIGRIATIVGEHGINLRNIGILESREEEIGQLILSFSHQRDLDAAVTVLTDIGYRVYRNE